MLFDKRHLKRSTPRRALGMGNRSRQIACEPLEERRLLSTSPGEPTHITQVGNQVFFTALTLPTFERVLWKSDGTSQGTDIVKDLTPEVISADIDELTNVNGVLFFRATVGTTGSELWKSDGTAAGTVMVKNIQNDNGAYPGSTPSQLTNVNGVLYFRAYDEIHGSELWKSDGTEAGTMLVKDIRAGTDNSTIDEMTNVGGTLFFAANSGVPGHELWKSDGTESGTVLVQAFNDGQSHEIEKFTVAGGELYFVEDRWTEAGDRLWKSDGTLNSAIELIASEPEHSVAELVEVDGDVYFGYGDLFEQFDLWRTDGTVPGTELVKVMPTVGSAAYLREMTNVNGTLFFTASATDEQFPNTELWMSDGTGMGTVVVKDIRPGSEKSEPQFLTNVDGVLYFTANDGTHGRELWTSDGTTNGTVLVKDLSAGTTGDGPLSLASFDGTLLFSWITDNNAGRRTLWKTDGTESGTVVVRPPGTVRLPFGDDFNRTPSTDLGIYWIETDGDVGMDNGKLVPFANTVSTVVLNDLDVADVTLSANVDLTGAEVGRSIALIARSQGPDDTNAYWGVFFRSDSGYAVQIYKNIGGVTTALRSVNVGGPAGNLRFEVFGTTLNLYFDDVLVTSVIDNALTLAGAAGIRQSGGTLDQFAAIVATPPALQNAVLPFSDNFNRVNSGFLGPFWTEHTGDAGILNNSIGLYANDTSIVTVNGINESDVSVSADLDVSTTPEQYSSGLIARYGGPGDQDFYLARIFHSGSNSFAAQIWKNVGGVYTPLRSVSVAGGAGNLRFDVVGNQLALYFNGSLVASTIDDSIAGPGQVGLRLAGGTVDNFVAEELTPPPVSNATLPFEDDFDRADSSSLGEFWTEQAGDLGIMGNVMVLYAEATSIATLNGVSEADVEVFAAFNTLNGGTNGLLARYSGPGDSNAYMALLQRHNHIISAQIWKNTGGGWVNLSHTEIGLATSLFYTLRFRVEGNHLTLLVNGNLVGDVLDNDIAGPGSVGVRQSSGESYYFSAATI